MTYKIEVTDELNMFHPWFDKFLDKTRWYDSDMYLNQLLSQYGAHNVGNSRHIGFEREEDATAFLLRWRHD